MPVIIIKGLPRVAEAELWTGPGICQELAVCLAFLQSGTGHRFCFSSASSPTLVLVRFSCPLMLCSMPSQHGRESASGEGGWSCQARVPTEEREFLYCSAVFAELPISIQCLPSSLGTGRGAKLPSPPYWQKSSSPFLFWFWPHRAGPEAGLVPHPVLFQ